MLFLIPVSSQQLGCDTVHARMVFVQWLAVVAIAPDHGL